MSLSSSVVGELHSKSVWTTGVSCCKKKARMNLLLLKLAFITVVNVKSLLEQDKYKHMKCGVRSPIYPPCYIYPDLMNGGFSIRERNEGQG